MPRGKVHIRISNLEGLDMATLFEIFLRVQSRKRDDMAGELAKFLINGCEFKMLRNEVSQRNYMFIVAMEHEVLFLEAYEMLVNEYARFRCGK